MRPPSKKSRLTTPGKKQSDALPDLRIIATGALEFYARLASIQHLNELPRAEFIGLCREFKRIFSSATEPRVSYEMGVNFGDPEPTMDELVAWRLREVHGRVCTTIIPLVDGRSVYHSDLFGTSPRPFPLYEIVRGRLTPVLTMKPFGSHHLGALKRALSPGTLFPFARCANCGAIFVRVRRQKYCRRDCTYYATERARDPVARRSYMREYMRQRRAKKNGNRA